MTILPRCPACGLESDEIRCPRCNTLKLIGCSGVCSSCASNCAVTTTSAAGVCEPNAKAGHEAEPEGTPLDR